VLVALASVGRREVPGGAPPVDAGRTWTHRGLRDGQQIPYITVDPRNADRLFVDPAER